MHFYEQELLKSSRVVTCFLVAAEVGDSRTLNVSKIEEVRENSEATAAWRNEDNVVKTRKHFPLHYAVIYIDPLGSSDRPAIVLQCHRPIIFLQSNRPTIKIKIKNKLIF